MEKAAEKTNDQLLKEIDQLKTKVAELENSETERKQAEKVLNESEERYKGIIQSTASCIAVYEAIDNGKDFVFVDFNPTAEEVERIPKDKVIGKKVTEVFPEIEEFGLFKVFQNVWKTGKPEYFPISVYQDDRIQGYRENYIYKLSSGEIVAVYQDMTEHKQIEEALQKSEEQYRTFVDNAPDAFYLSDMEGRFIDVNEAACADLGYTREELLNLSIHDVDVNFLPDKLSEILGSLTYNESQIVESAHKRKDGGVFPVEVRIRTFGPKEKPLLLSLARNVIDRKLIEEKTEQLSRIFEDSLNEIFLFDSDTLNFTQVNKAAQDNLGYTMAELQKMTPLSFKPEFTAESFAKLVDPLRKGEKEKIIFGTVHQRKDQSLYNVEVHLQLLHFEKGSLFTAIILDISERKKAEDSIAIQSQRLINILEGTNAGTWNWNIQTGDCSFNERWAEIIGRTLKELEPLDINTWINNVHPDDLPNANALLDQHFKGELDYFDVEFRQPHKDGNWVWVNARGKVVEWSEDGKALQMSGTHLDITERKLAEEELTKHHEQLEELVAERTKELEEKNKKLDDAMKVFVGRELTIRDLQNRIKALGGK